MDLSKLHFISKSLMKTARICTERMWKLFVESIPSESSPAAEFGILGHQIWRNGSDAQPESELGHLLPFVRKAWELCPTPSPDAEVKYEAERQIQLEGVPVPLRGRLDRVIYMPDWTIIVDDLKFGLHEDDDFERDLYVCLAEYPRAKSATFRYICPTENRVWEHHYSRELLDTLPELLRSYVRELGTWPVMPTPGPHCEDMYGIPCQFLGRGCSLDKAANHLAVQEISEPETVKTLQALLEGKPEIVSALPAEAVSRAYVGLQQLTGITKQVQKNIKAWAETNGKFQVGDTAYGIVESPVFRTDKFKALQILLESKDFKTILSAIDISNSTIEKCKDPDLKASLEAEAVRYSHDIKRFGVIKKEIQPELEKQGLV